MNWRRKRLLLLLGNRVEPCGSVRVRPRVKTPPPLKNTYSYCHGDNGDSRGNGDH